MKKTFLMTCAFLTLTAGLALAGPGGLNLGWNDCGGDPSTLNRVFACNTNSGVPNTLVGSFVAPSFITAMSANEVVFDMQSVGVSLPTWWGLRTGLCRAGALVPNFDFTGGPFTCYDYWQGGAIGTIAQDPPNGNKARFKGVFALPAGDARITAIGEGTEVYSFKAVITNAKTVNTACTGCNLGACIVLNSIALSQPVSEPGGTKFVSAPAVRNFVTWQGGTGEDCYLATPSRNSTWGQVKSLYR